MSGPRRAGRRAIGAAPRCGGVAGRPSLIVVCVVDPVARACCCASPATLLAPHDPHAQDLLAGLRAPSSARILLGTDDSGRDVLSRDHRGRAVGACVGPLLIALGAMLIGTSLGLLAGYRGGALDSVDHAHGSTCVLSLPGLLVAIVCSASSAAATAGAVVVLILLHGARTTRA